jgi:hypothetical protein
LRGDDRRKLVVAFDRRRRLGGGLDGCNYVRFLRPAAPAARLRLKGLLDPIVVVLDGKVIGVFMPIKPETPAARPG